MPSHAFFKDLHTNIKNRLPQERLFTCRLTIYEQKHLDESYLLHVVPTIFF